MIWLTHPVYACYFPAIPAHNMLNQLYFNWIFKPNALQLSLKSGPVLGARGWSFQLLCSHLEILYVRYFYVISPVNLIIFFSIPIMTKDYNMFTSFILLFIVVMH